MDYYCALPRQFVPYELMFVPLTFPQIQALQQSFLRSFRLALQPLFQFKPPLLPLFASTPLEQLLPVLLSLAMNECPIQQGLHLRSKCY